jgi:hypothetical protein
VITITGRLVSWQTNYHGGGGLTRLERGALRWPNLITVKPVLMLIRNGDIGRPVGRVTSVRDTLTGLDMTATLRAGSADGEDARNEISHGRLPYLVPVLMRSEGQRAPDGVRQIQRAQLAAVSLETLDHDAGVIQTYGGLPLLAYRPSVLALN